MKPKRIGRPKGVHKTKVNFLLRTTVWRQFRRFVGPTRHVGAMVEQALTREMSLAQGENHGTV